MSTTTNQTERASGSALAGVALGAFAVFGSTHLPVSEGNDGWTYTIVAVLLAVIVTGFAALVTHHQRRTLIGFSVAAGSLFVLFWTGMAVLGSGAS